MKPLRRLARTGVCPTTRVGVVIALALLADPTAAAQQGAAPIQLPDWQRLEFKASKLFVTARSSLEVELVDAADASSAWVPIETAHEPPPQITLVRSTASFLGRTSTTDVWLDPSDLRAFQRHAVDSGSRQRHKIYRFGRGEIRALRSEPETKDEESLPEPQWTRRSEQRLELQGTPLVTDPVAVFYLLSQKPTTEQELQVVTSNTVGSVRVELAERGSVATEAAIVSGDTTRPLGDNRAALRYAVTPADPDSDFSLLGLEGAITVWVDEEFGVPLEVRGKISPVGTVRVRLQAAVLRSTD